MEFGLRELRRRADVELHERVDLRAWTTLGVGGIASLVARCHSENGVRDALDLAVSHGLPWLSLGGGTRIIAPDQGVRVPVVSLTGELARWEPELDGIVAGGGANLAQVSRAATRAGLSGLERLGSHDHSIGGLVRAAASGVVDLGRTLHWVDLQRPGAPVERWHPSSSRLVPSPADLRRRVVVRARFRLRPTALADIRPRSTPTGRSRALRSTGPVFLDSLDSAASDLLAEAGCSTAGVGGVRFGGPRGNELLASRSATASDVLALCRRVRDRVLATTGVRLAPALAFVDEEGTEIEL